MAPLSTHWAHLVPLSVVFSCSNSPSGLTMLKAPLTSSMTAPAPPPLASVLCAIVTTTTIANLPLAEPDCKKCSSLASRSLPVTTFSPIFPTQLIRLIGLQAFARLWSFPGFGIMTTLISLHSAGIFPVGNLVGNLVGNPSSSPPLVSCPPLLYEAVVESGPVLVRSCFSLLLVHPELDFCTHSSDLLSTTLPSPTVSSRSYSSLSVMRLRSPMLALTLRLLSALFLLIP